MVDSTGHPRSLRDRLDEVYRRLRLSPRLSSADDTLRLLCETLDEVEDAWSGVAKQVPPPSPSNPDGRMYCPLSDFLLRNDDGSILALTRGHRIEIDADGSLRIISKLSGQTEFEK